jgi:hypothetical protein
MVTLFGSRGSMMSTAEQDRITKARDLVNEYARQSSSITVRHIDPDTQVEELKAVYQELHDRFAVDVKPAREAVDQAITIMESLQTAATEQAAAIDALLEGSTIANPMSIQPFRQAKGILEIRIKENTTVLKQLERARDTPMPDYAGQILELQSALQRWSTLALQPIGATFDTLSNDRKQANAVIDAALRIVDYTERTRIIVNEGLNALSRVSVPEPYTRLLVESATTDSSVLVLGPEGTRKARFVALTQMFLGATRTEDGQGSQEQVFRGEELLTAAMIRMQMAVPPLVVFAYTGPAPAIGQGGAYRLLGERLEGAGFEVIQWNPMGIRSPGSPPTAPTPPPTPRANQDVVWIFPPLTQPDASNPMPTGADRVVQLARDRMDQGDGVLMMVRYDAAARFSATDPFVQLLSVWGIEANPGKLILHEVKVDESRSQASMQFLIRNWPTELPITQALAGLPGLSYAASPLKEAKEKSESVRVWPLIELREDRQWAEGDFGGDTMPKFNAAFAAESFNVAMAAEHDGRRLVAISDPAFGMDSLLNAGRGGGTADQTGAALPANAEFFVNSAYWLAHLDTLIAASARTQDIRRIDPISASTQRTIRIGLLAGLPMLTLVVGVGVWLARRRA